MEITKVKNYQHETLRVPRGWTDQDKALVIQLERILDDVYRKLGKLTEAVEALQAEANSNP